MPGSYTAGLLRLLILVAYNSKGTDRSLETIHRSSSLHPAFWGLPCKHLQGFSSILSGKSVPPPSLLFCQVVTLPLLQTYRVTETSNYCDNSSQAELGESSGPGCQGRSQELFVSLVNCDGSGVGVGGRGREAELLWNRSHFAYP